MSEENAPQKERYLREVEQKLLHRELDARLLEDGLIHVRYFIIPAHDNSNQPSDIVGFSVGFIGYS